MYDLLANALERKLTNGVVEVDDGFVHAEVDVVDLDRLGVSVRGVKVRAQARGNIVDQAARLPDALDVLPDPVRPIEVDPTLGGAVLRSRPRRARQQEGRQKEGRQKEDKEYYEVRTDGREVSVEKLRAGPEGRAAVPFTLTREQLGRLVEGVGGVVAGVDPDPDPT